MDVPGKTRLSVQGRSEGDGMEFALSPAESSITSEPTSNASQSKNYAKNFIPSPGKKKEPKFVPYEPYKAAVSPILYKNSNCIDKYVVSEKAKQLATNIIKQNLGTQDIFLPETKQINDLTSESSIIKQSSVNNYTNHICQLEEKLSKLEKEKNELEAQFSIQTQVNADLKKMLVAALGEDMQMKVQYMSEDKAKLGKDVLSYVEQLTKKDEEIEKFSVECNIWKSKFDASSLLVKELALYKSTSSKKIMEINQVLKSLMKEHEEIFKQQQISYSILLHVQDAFNPCSKSSKKHCAQNLLEVSKEIQCLSNSIQSRLLGTASLDSKSLVKNSRQLTPAECYAYKMLSDADGCPVSKCSSPVGSDLSPGRTACSILPHECSKVATINCCNHCSGEILLL